MLTREQLNAEIQEKEEDLRVFTEAFDLIYKRYIHSQDSMVSSIPLHNWSGTHAVLNTMEVVIHHMERVLEEFKAMKPADERPKLRLVVDNAKEEESS